MDESTDDDKTHFGFQRIAKTEKTARVAGVFDSVAQRYDIMNDLMSFGIHRAWKFFTTELAGVRSGARVLDLAGGTGDLAAKFAHRVGPDGQVVLADINRSMLAVGRDRLLDRGIGHAVQTVQADAERLPFRDNHFDVITMAFGLRNVTDKDQALASMHRLLRPGGRLLVLEFSKPQSALLSRAYDTYSFRALPFMGRLVAGDADSYRYLAESIRMHPDQETLRRMMLDAGFDRVRYHNLTGGIVALHIATKGFQHGS